MTIEQFGRAKAIETEMADVKRELEWWNSPEVVSIPQPISLRVRGSLAHVPDDLFKFFREDCVKHLQTRITELETEFAKL